MLFPDPIASEGTAPPQPVGRSKKSETPAWTVTQLIQQINLSLKQNLSRVIVEGEISNFRRQGASGHLYFSLKDEGGNVSAVAWATLAKTLRFSLQDGLAVRISGKIEYYGPHGRLQLIADKITPVGEGELELAFRQLREKLQAEGLFDLALKKALPPFPERIGIVTGANTAALRDMLESLKRRWPIAEIRIFPVLVQGEMAAGEIATTLRWISQLTESPDSSVDLVLLGRGGGSREDLWAFNREEVARAIAACKVPIVTGIGHEHDLTIADLVADVRALTPTDAVLRSTPDFESIRRTITAVQESLADRMRQRVERLRRELERSKTHVLARLLENRISRGKQLAAESSRRLQTALLDQLNKRKHQLGLLAGKLHSISPLRVLSRGYSLTQLVKEEHGPSSLLTSVQGLKPGAVLNTRLVDGEILSVVREVQISVISEKGIQSGQL